MSSHDDFLKRLDRLEKKAARGSAHAEDALNNPNEGAAGVGDFLARLGSLGRFFETIGFAAKSVWINVLRPVWQTVEPIASWIGRKYRDKIWNRFAYSTAPDGGRVFSSKRASIVVVSTAAVLVMAVPIARGTYTLGLDSFKMAFTMRTATVYLHTPDSHLDNTYSVKGCVTLGECDPEDVVYYNIESSFLRHLWTLVNKGALYVPKRIVGTISPDSNNKCVVKIYGAYYEKTMLQIGIYPELLDVSCMRVSEQGELLGEM